MKKIIKEACIGSLSDAKKYLETDKINLIDRIETCSDLDQGGLTPDLETFNYIKNKNIDQVIMIRRSKHFIIQSQDELNQLILDLNFYLDQGAKSFIFGYLNDKNEIDIDTCKTLINEIKKRNNADLKWVFHMAIDEVDNYEKAFETLIDLEFSRVLTKGGKNLAINNIDRIKKVNNLYNEKIEIIIGGKVTSENYLKICHQTNINQVHGTKIA